MKSHLTKHDAAVGGARIVDAGGGEGFIHSRSGDSDVFPVVRHALLFMHTDAGIMPRHLAHLGAMKGQVSVEPHFTTGVIDPRHRHNRILQSPVDVISPEHAAVRRRLDAHHQDQRVFCLRVDPGDTEFGNLVVFSVPDP